MSEFKSGDIVKFGFVCYTYACVHPLEKHLSIVLDRSELPRLLCTKELILAPKTHTVNGFEVPAPISEADFEVWDVDSTPLYCFLSSYRLGWASLYRDDISAVSVKCGFVFRSESDIKKNIAALQGINPSTVE